MNEKALIIGILFRPRRNYETHYQVQFLRKEDRYELQIVKIKNFESTTEKVEKIRKLEGLSLVKLVDDVLEWSQENLATQKFKLEYFGGKQ